LKISVIIPAHEEANGIEACLDSLLTGLGEHELQLLIVCNGCTDRTAEIARSVASRSSQDIQVLEEPRANKSAALNLGDAAAQHFPRFYVDGDVLVSGADLLGVGQVLEHGSILAAAPRLRVSLDQSNSWVRRFYRIWMRLPYVQDNMIGCGVYGLSATGRGRFKAFPNLIADDCYVRLQFSADEKESVSRYSFFIQAPRSLSNLIRINSRRLEGQRQLRDHFHETTHQESGKQKRALLQCCAKPLQWFDLAVYLWVRLTSSGLLRWRLLRGRPGEWSRDESSRLNAQDAPLAPLTPEKNSKHRVS